MPIIRSKKDRHFTQIANLIFKDHRLSYKAKGLMATMLTFHDDWVIVGKHLVSLSTDGTEAVRSGLKELVQCGYLQIITKRDSKGRMAGTEYILSEIPEKMPPGLAKLLPCDSRTEGASDKEIPNGDNPHTELPHEESPDKGDRPHTNNGFKTKMISTNICPSISDIRTEVMEQIGYDALLEEVDTQRLDSIVSAIASVLHSTKPYTRIGGEDYLTEDVKEQFHKLKADHIQYVVDSIDTVAPAIRSVKGYLTTALYNSVDTFDMYSNTKAKHDLKHGDYIKRCRDLLNSNDEEEYGDEVY